MQMPLVPFTHVTFSETLQIPSLVFVGFSYVIVYGFAKIHTMASTNLALFNILLNRAKTCTITCLGGSRKYRK